LSESAIEPFRREGDEGDMATGRSDPSRAHEGYDEEDRWHCGIGGIEIVVGGREAEMANVTLTRNSNETAASTPIVRQSTDHLYF
jgi:hypothetical protein